jgi:hypothetical protein
VPRIEAQAILIGQQRLEFVVEEREDVF